MPPCMSRALPASEHRNDARPIRLSTRRPIQMDPDRVKITIGYGLNVDFRGKPDGKLCLMFLVYFEHKDGLKTWFSPDTYLKFRYRPKDGRHYWVIACPTAHFAEHVLLHLTEPLKTALERLPNLTKIPTTVMRQVDPFPTVTINKGRSYDDDKTTTHVWLSSDPGHALAVFTLGFKRRGFKFNDFGGMPGATHWNKLTDDVQGIYDTLLSWGFRVQDITIASFSMRVVDAQIAAAVAAHATTALAETAPAPAAAAAPVSTENAAPALEPRAFL